MFKRDFQVPLVGNHEKTRRMKIGGGNCGKIDEEKKGLVWKATGLPGAEAGWKTRTFQCQKSKTG